MLFAEILRISKNKFKGTIPESFKSLKNLEVLHLDENEFSGTIPNMFDGAPRLYNIQLQKNRLKGPIPNKLWHLGDMSKLNKCACLVGWNPRKLLISLR